MEKTEKRWTKIAKDILLNKTITGVRYMTRKETDNLGWYKRPVAFHLNNGVWIYPSMDDEGNDGGALFTTDEEEPTLPLLYGRE
tara:strand:+ start:253 stop:504 length:252 start_codon:yes stop_codon:yes gene_type:complete